MAQVRLRLTVFFGFILIMLCLSFIYTISMLLNSREPVVPSGALHLLEQGMKERIVRINKVCENKSIGTRFKLSQFQVVHPPAPQYSVFYFDQKRHLAYCPIYKAASTSILNWLLQLEGYSQDDIKQSKTQISELARRLYPSIDYPQAEEVMDSSMRLMIVRHPFERILSAYRDKLEDSQVGREHGTWHYYQKYGRSIVARYRKDQMLTKLEPTFPEFVDYLINTDLTLYADDHWIPYYLYCTPCLVQYDLIIKFETFEQDITLLLARLHLKQAPSWRHVSRGGPTNDLVNSYYSQLTSQQVRDLYEKYKFDFELFDYSISPYLSLAQD